MLSIEIFLDFKLTINLTNKPCFGPLCGTLTFISIARQESGGSLNFPLNSELKKITFLVSKVKLSIFLKIFYRVHVQKVNAICCSDIMVYVFTNKTICEISVCFSLIILAF